MTKKCFSVCRKQKVRDCNKTRRCRYNVGEERQFCRLDMSKYRLDKNCVTRTRITNKNRYDEAAKVIQRNVRIVKNRGKQTVKIDSAEQKRLKGEMIKKFMISNKFKQKAHYLNTICSNSGFCIALGSKEEENISKFFEHFVTFEYAKSPVKTIGKDSANGFIKEIIYQRAKYRSYAILKSQKTNEADSLFYEYLVGKYINTVTNRFPNFVKTYGLLKYHTEEDFEKCKTPELHVNDFRKLLTPLKYINLHNPDLGRLSCNPESYLNCLLIEHVENPISVKDIIKLGGRPILGNYNNHLLQYELMYILYQVYFALYCLKDNFTHYDLHMDNVLLYKPRTRSYMTYHYHTNGTEITFNTQYIAKIIDYGRCFYKYDNTKNSNEIYKQLCAERACKPNCGHKYGHSYFKDKETLITKIKSNISHDLRYANEIKMAANKVWTQDTKDHDVYNLYTVLNKVQYSIGITDEDNKRYGTKETKGTKYTPANTVIWNVIQMKKALEYLMNPLIPTDTYYETQHFTKLGDLHIYEDRAMNFIPST
jgi:hypothetical protein